MSGMAICSIDTSAPLAPGIAVAGAVTSVTLQVKGPNQAADGQDRLGRQGAGGAEPRPVVRGGYSICVRAMQMWVQAFLAGPFGARLRSGGLVSCVDPVRERATPGTDFA